MAISLNKTDLWFTNDGDYLIDGTGDIKDTSDSTNSIEGLRQQIVHRIIIERDGWRLHPEVCAGLEKYIGRAVDNKIISLLQSDVTRVLTADGFFKRSDVTVKAIDLLDGAVAVLIYINAIGNNKPVLTMAYSITQNNVIRIR